MAEHSANTPKHTADTLPYRARAPYRVEKWHILIPKLDYLTPLFYCRIGLADPTLHTNTPSIGLGFWYLSSMTWLVCSNYRQESVPIPPCRTSDPASKYRQMESAAGIGSERVRRTTAIYCTRCNNTKTTLQQHQNDTVYGWSRWLLNQTRQIVAQKKALEEER